MRAISLLCLFLSFCWAQEKNISSNQILYRFYLLKRLRPAVDYMQQGHINKGIIKREIENVLHDWHDLCSYRNIGDMTFEHYVAESIYVACMHCLGRAYCSSCSTDSILQHLDHLLHPETRLVSWQEDYKLDDGAVLLRYYIIQRLVDAETACNKLTSQKIFTSTNNGIVFDDEKEFHHQRIKKIVKQLQKEQTLQPLLDLWEDIHCFRFVQDQLFIKEALIVLFIAQKNAYCNLSMPTARKEPLVYQLLQLYEIIEAIPMHEVLDAVDFIAIALKEVCKSEKQTDQQSKGKKRKLYWIINLSVILGGIAFKVFNHYRLYYVIYDYFTVQKVPLEKKL